MPAFHRFLVIIYPDLEEEKLNIQQALDHKKDKNQKLSVELSRLRRLIKPDQDAGESILASLKKRVGAIAAGEISMIPSQSTSTSIGSSSDPGSLENLEDSMRRVRKHLFSKGKRVDGYECEDGRI